MSIKAIKATNYLIPKQVTTRAHVLEMTTQPLKKFLGMSPKFSMSADLFQSTFKMLKLPNQATIHVHGEVTEKMLLKSTGKTNVIADVFKEFLDVRDGVNLVAYKTLGQLRLRNNAHADIGKVMGHAGITGDASLGVTVLKAPLESIGKAKARVFTALGDISAHENSDVFVRKFEGKILRATGNANISHDNRLDVGVIAVKNGKANIGRFK